VRLPSRGFHDLGQHPAAGLLQQVQDLGGFAALAHAVSFRLRGLGCFGGLLGRGRFLGRGGLVLLPLALFWLLGARFFEVAVFFEEAFSGATAAFWLPWVLGW